MIRPRRPLSELPKRMFLAIALLGSMLAPGSALADGPAPTKQQARYEVDFMIGMIEHHQMAVTMSQLCQEKAVHEDLQAMCQEIETAQLEEIATMQSWLQEWYRISYEPVTTKQDMRMHEKMAALSPTEFEIEFMKRMIRHHWGAVVEARKCQDKAYHPELIQMCHDIETVQLTEIAQLQEWLCEWYDLCNYGPNVGHDHP